MALAAAEKQHGELTEEEAEQVKAYAAATDNVGLFFGEDIFVAFGAIALMHTFLLSSNIDVEPLHIAVWEEVIRHRLAGQPIAEPEEGDFPPVTETSEEAWLRTLAKFDETHRSLVEAIATLTDERLSETVVGKDYTVEYMLRGIARHHVYHAGQIALLKKVEA